MVSSDVICCIFLSTQFANSVDPDWTAPYGPIGESDLGPHFWGNFGFKVYWKRRLNLIMAMKELIQLIFA